MTNKHNISIFLFRNSDINSNLSDTSLTYNMKLNYIAPGQWRNGETINVVFRHLEFEP